MAENAMLKKLAPVAASTPEAVAAITIVVARGYSAAAEACGTSGTSFRPMENRNGPSTGSQERCESRAAEEALAPLVAGTKEIM